jgi:hypothetical protein
MKTLKLFPSTGGVKDNNNNNNICYGIGPLIDPFR